VLEQARELLDVRQLTTTAVEFLPKLVLALLIVIAFVALYRIVRVPLRAGLRRADFHDALVDLLIDKLFRYAVIGVGVVMAADQLGVNIGAALAGMGIAGIAVGFAAQDTVANVISGVLIFWDKPFVVGDWIETENQYGVVADITLRTTRIRTPRNTYVVIPNKRIIDQVLENFSKHGQLRLDVPVGIAYKENIPAAREVLLEAAREVETVKADPAPDVIVEELDSSSVNLKVRVWIDDARDRQPTTFRVLETSKLALDAAGIQIPYPHLQLFVDDVQDRVWSKAAAIGRAETD